MAIEIELLKKQIIENIQLLIDKKKIDEAMNLIEEYTKINPDEIEIYSMKAVVFIMQGKLNEAEMILTKGLDIDNENFDLNYNFGYLYEQRGNFVEALKYYKKAIKKCNDESIKNSLGEIIKKISCEQQIVPIENKQKMVFFVKEGWDGFLSEVINGLSDEYITKKIIVTNSKQIDEWMLWADICWFEWCDQLLAYGSNHSLANDKKIICRIHGYEVYTDLIMQPNWKYVDNLIIVAPHIRRIFDKVTKDVDKGSLKIDTIFCGVDIETYPLNIKKKGFNLGYIGYINNKKNLPLTLDIFKKLHDLDKRYKLFLAGEIQDARVWAYINYFIKEYNLLGSIQFEGWKSLKEKVEWFKKIDYMVISSIDEGLCYAAAESMSSGIKPILHNCEGIKDHYDKKYIFNSLDEAIKKIVSNEYNSQEYRDFIIRKYDNKIQIRNIKEVIQNIKKGVNTDLNVGNKLKTVLILTPSIGIGGAEEYTINKCKWLVQHGYNAIVAARSGQWEERLKNTKAKFYNIEWLGYEDPKEISNNELEIRLNILKDIVEKEKVDIIEGHNLYPAVYGYMFSQKYKVPFLFNCLNTIDFTINNKYVPLLKELNNKDIYYIVNEIANKDIENSNNTILDKCKYVSVAIDIKENIKIKKDNYILTVCRLAPTKIYVANLIKSFTNMCIKRKLKNYKLVIVGDGPLFSQIEEFANKCNKEIKANMCFIEMKGFIYGEELERLYSNCLMYVGLGLSAITAAAYKKPTILATHYPYDTEYAYGYFDDPKFIAPLGKMLEMREKDTYENYMYSLIRNDMLYGNVAKECYNTWKNNFSMDETMKKWIDEYYKVIYEKRGF